MILLAAGLGQGIAEADLSGRESGPISAPHVLAQFRHSASIAAETGLQGHERRRCFP